MAELESSRLMHVDELEQQKSAGKLLSAHLL